ncbi:MAG: EAL domain-containing protein, partial [Gammaproteobacteria bacterium]|nr:EAL domain-containing protein [Gammaproteobacteria bacterium]
ETIKAGKARVNEELVTFADSGDKVSLETTKTPMYDKDGKLIGVLGIGHNVTRRKEIENYAQKNLEILEMIAVGSPTPKIYDQIALMYEARHPGMRCSMLELGDGVLLHGGAPSLPQAYCDAVHGLKIGPDVGSCGASTFTGKRVLVENIETDPKWAAIKGVALPHGMRCCWSEPIKNSSGVVLGAFGMYYDYPALPNDLESEDLKSAARLAGIVMERDHTQKRIREMAYTDELTGIANRAHFYQYIKDHTKLSKRNNADFGLLYIDLDDFKGINDTLGHDAGDQLLIEIATRLKFICRDIDFIARLGGDEFCIIVKDIDDEFSTGHVAKRCLQAVSKPIEILGRAITPACSIGIAHFPEDGIDISTLLKVADTSLYAAKEMGKNQFAFYKPELTQKAEYRFKVEQNLRQAIQQQQLTLVYQPQIKTCTNEIIGVEVLSRWHHPNLGTIAPTEFIPIAERIGIIKQHTVWLLKEACLQATRWKNAGLPQIRISVNISANLFLEKHFNNLIHNILKETGMPPNKLELEVTESVVQTGYENLAVFKELKALGVLIAIDDFGTGYSSFASLKQLEADNLKIDRYFIKDMLTDPKCGHLVTSMIEIGHNLEHGIIAEGVETVEQLNVLKKLGCEAIQGFLYSQPLEVEEVEQFLSAKIKNGISYWPNQAF